MAGHSHWANIKHKKGANDAKKAAVITQMGKLIKVAVQLGGPDVDTNPRLRLSISKARAQNMTRDAIERAIKKAAGMLDNGKQIEELVYEGYASNGVAVVVEAATDNRNRTAPELRKLFERGGGALGAPGCVSWQFHMKALFLVAGSDEDGVMEAILEADADAEDISITDNGISITAAPEYYDSIADALKSAQLEVLSSDLTKVADNTVEIDNLDAANKIQSFIENLESHDDVSSVYSNFTPTDAIAQEME